jgi:hypothetical protein
MKNQTCLGRAIEWDLGYSESGKEQVAVAFQLEEGVDAGQRITWRGYFTEKTTERTLQSLRYCGWDGINLADLTGLDKNLVQLVIENEEYNGKTYSKVAWVNQLGGLALKNRMDDKARAAFAAKMKGAALAVPKDLAKGMRPEVRKSSGNDEPECNMPEDDLPF